VESGGVLLNLSQKECTNRTNIVAAKPAPVSKARKRRAVLSDDEDDASIEAENETNASVSSDISGSRGDASHSDQESLKDSTDESDDDHEEDDDESVQSNAHHHAKKFVQHSKHNGKQSSMSDESASSEEEESDAGESEEDSVEERNNSSETEESDYDPNQEEDGNESNEEDANESDASGAEQVNKRSVATKTTTFKTSLAVSSPVDSDDDLDPDLVVDDHDELRFARIGASPALAATQHTVDDDETVDDDNLDQSLIMDEQDELQCARTCPTSAKKPNRAVDQDETIDDSHQSSPKSWHGSRSGEEARKRIVMKSTQTICTTLITERSATKHSSELIRNVHTPLRRVDNDRTQSTAGGPGSAPAGAVVALATPRNSRRDETVWIACNDEDSDCSSYDDEVVAEIIDTDSEDDEMPPQSPCAMLAQTATSTETARTSSGEKVSTCASPAKATSMATVAIGNECTRHSETPCSQEKPDSCSPTCFTEGCNDDCDFLGACVGEKISSPSFNNEVPGGLASIRSHDESAAEVPLSSQDGLDADLYASIVAATANISPIQRKGDRSTLQKALEGLSLDDSTKETTSSAPPESLSYLKSTIQRNATECAVVPLPSPDGMAAIVRDSIVAGTSNTPQVPRNGDCVSLRKSLDGLSHGRLSFKEDSTKETSIVPSERHMKPEPSQQSLSDQTSTVQGSATERSEVPMRSPDGTAAIIHDSIVGATSHPSPVSGSVVYASLRKSLDVLSLDRFSLNEDSTETGSIVPSERHMHPEPSRQSLSDPKSTIQRSATEFAEAPLRSPDGKAAIVHDSIVAAMPRTSPVAGSGANTSLRKSLDGLLLDRMSFKERAKRKTDSIVPSEYNIHRESPGTALSAQKSTIQHEHADIPMRSPYGVHDSIVAATSHTSPVPGGSAYASLRKSLDGLLLDRMSFKESAKRETDSIVPSERHARPEPSQTSLPDQKSTIQRNATESAARKTGGRVLRREGSVKRGKWRFGAKIGSGAFGVVRLGMNTETGTLMAVKSLKMEPTVMKDAEREIDLLRSLKHENIVRYLGAEMDSKFLHIFQEWVPAGSITTLLSKFGPFPLDVLRNYLEQILHGVQYLHDNKIMHRDIKGSNILVSDDGIVKLADLGAGKRFAQLKCDLMMSLTTRGSK
jgi:Protein kinase domain